MKIIDLSGKRFGRLVVIKRTGTKVRNKQKRPLWSCMCDCGKKIETMGESLRNGHTRSCGCLALDKLKERATKHGMVKSHFWLKWYSMRQRCNNKYSSTYYKYGARGVKVIPRWETFENFRDDMYESYLLHSKEYGEKETTLDRIDLGNYEKNNCRWATNSEQAKNKRYNSFVEYKGKKMTCSDWAKETGIMENTIWQRLHTLKWSVEKALTTPTRKNQRWP